MVCKLREFERVSSLVFATFAVVCASGCGRPGMPSQAASAAVQETAVQDMRTMIDDRTTGPGLDRFRYSGRWEKVDGRDDGRSQGTSTRSFHAGDVASLAFSGTQIRLYGVLGLKGGDALVSIDGAPPEKIHFGAASIKANALVYTSPVLDPSVHTLTIVVGDRPESPGARGFVNVDSAVVTNERAPGD
jgi:hypothetical protein